jgi:DNA-binding MarR family transcriptional regulator
MIEASLPTIPVDPQSPTDPRPETPCTCAKLRRTARRLTRAYDRALRPSGLRLTQYSVLANVARRSGLSVTDLAELLAMDRTTLTRNLRPLSQRGWVRVAPGPDRRSRAVEITEPGRLVYQEALPLWRAAEQAFRQRMGQDQAAALGQLLDTAVASAQP